jgi:signal transduction histidine kinase/ligand-binding sensor domain-containing protein
LKSLNVCREQRGRHAAFVSVALALVCLALNARAVDPNRSLSQYLYSRWSSDKGFSAASVTSFAQTPDGYLWIGTEKGLFRFDGLSFQLFQQATPMSFPITSVQGLTVDASGNLWILLQNTKVLRYRDGKFELGKEQAEAGITAVGKRRDGSVFLSSLALGPLTYRDGKFESIGRAAQPAEVSNAGASGQSASASSPAAPVNGSTDQLSTRLAWATGVVPHRYAEPNSAVLSVAESTDGRIWLGTRDSGIFYLSDGRVAQAANSPAHAKINCVLALDDRAVLIGSDNGILLWNGTKVTSDGLPAALLHVRAQAMIRDRDSNIWIGTSNGLLRYRIAAENNNAVVEANSTRASGPVTAMFEDREGDIWIGGPAGVERLRDSTFVSYAPATLHAEATGAVYAKNYEDAWFAPIEGGLRRVVRGQTQSITNDGLAQDVVYSIAGRDDEIWIGRQQGGLTQLKLSGDKILAARTFTRKDGLAENGVYSVFAAPDGAIWAATLSGGVSEFRNGRFKTYTTADGLASNTVAEIAESRDGTMWFATANGLSALSTNEWRSIRPEGSLNFNNVNCLLASTSNDVLWVGTAAGLAFVRGGHAEVPLQVPGVLRESILGIAEDQLGWLWLSTSSHVLRVSVKNLLSGKVPDEDVRIYGMEDGLLGTEGVKRDRSVFADATGKIWFSMNRGLSVVDPLRAARNSTPAIAQVDGISADGNPVTTNDRVRLGEAHRRVTFNYSAVDLKEPERVRYRYKLDGLDEEWSEPVATREVTYNNLSSGAYRFHVMASNGDGAWNSAEAALALEIAPAYWQTWWFRFASGVLVALVMLLLYRLRMRRLTEEMNIRFEERLAERTRIAQELHDTLLQGFVSASMQLHVANDHISEQSSAKPFVERVLQLMGRVIDEGRNAVRGLRLPDTHSINLEKAFCAIQQELYAAVRDVTFRVCVEGEERPLRPVIREGIYRIGREGLINAFRHSRASKIEVYLQYSPKQLRVVVRDNGAGIDQEVLRAGRDGHWGLSGMRERADEIGAKLRVLSNSGAGTEVELTLPGKVAYEPRGTERRWGWRFKAKPAMIPPNSSKQESEVPQ